MRFTKKQAMIICQQRLPEKYVVPRCYTCYYHDGHCELNTIYVGRYCGRYVNNAMATNKVHEAILSNPGWCIMHWDDLCQTDKELFEAIYNSRRRFI